MSVTRTLAWSRIVVLWKNATSGNCYCFDVIWNKDFISKIQSYRYCHQSKSKIHFFDRKTIWTPKLLGMFYVYLFWCVCCGECSEAYHTMYIISWKTYTWYCKLMLNILVTIFIWESRHTHQQTTSIHLLCYCTVPC